MVRTERIAFAALCCLLLSVQARAEEPDARREAEKAQEAEEDAAKNAEPRDTFDAESTLKGRVILFPQPQDEDVPGAFNVRSKVYLLKVRDANLMKEILTLNGKTVLLAGKVRNQGKYFIVEGIPKPEPPPPRMDNPAGL